MEEELDQIDRNETWELVPRPKYNNMIGIKWVFRDKLNEDGHVTRNKESLISKGYAKVEGIDFEKTFARVSRMEVIRLILAYACSKRIAISYLLQNLRVSLYKPSTSPLSPRPPWTQRFLIWILPQISMMRL
jgi:hypothetical protein